MMKTLTKEEKKEEKKKETGVSLDQKIVICSMEVITKIMKEAKTELIADVNCEKDQNFTKQRFQGVEVSVDREILIEIKEVHPMHPTIQSEMQPAIQTVR